MDNLPQAVKGLLIINIAVFVISIIVEATMNIDLGRVLGLYFYKSDLFRPYQIITHMFMHGSLMHLVFNMYALWMFGQVIERVWGAKKFLIYYFVTGFGAVVLHTFVNYLQYQSIVAGMSNESVQMVLNEGAKLISHNQNWTDPDVGALNLFMHIPTVGASGAVFGLLLAFGMLFPNIELQLMFIPIPIKAKYFVMGYGALELYMGVQNAAGDNIAHFAHLGGMLFGFILIKIWDKTNKNNYYQEF
ncbi:MAG: rhomboid family intramembrane serine protease [Chlorobi bacterium]|nr:rhomboid family intramembrane serine protease [Chlorobiota bacterium]